MDKQDVIYLLRSLNIETTRELDLSNKDITEIPADIGNFRNLEYLNLSYNNIEELPSEICKLQNLRTLLLPRNELNSLPQDFHKLSNLNLLDVSYNKLIQMPFRIEEMTNLISLDVSYCKITTLPLEFTKLLNLKEVHLEENPFEYPPARVIRRGLYATMYYLTEQKKRKTASKVIMQVYNLPQKLQVAFKQYLSCFRNIISDEEKGIFNFDINFINPDLDLKTELDTNIENKLYNVIELVNKEISERTGKPIKKSAGLFDAHVHELKDEINQFNEALNGKMLEIRDIQNKMRQFSNMLENQVEK